ncbi:MAG TPA: STAS domain-containing protein [Acidimicrobiales bacterium]|nr:STAS domain-containing protein [Acidimicrobiales bacterium]
MAGLALRLEPVTVTTTVVHVAGELDGATIAQLTDCVSSVEPGSTTVILDLLGLTFMDSMGIGALVGLHKDLDAAARLLQLRNVNGHPLRVFEMTELDRVLHLI